MFLGGWQYILNMTIIIHITVYEVEHLALVGWHIPKMSSCQTLPLVQPPLIDKKSLSVSARWSRSVMPEMDSAAKAFWKHGTVQNKTSPPKRSTISQANQSNQSNLLGMVGQSTTDPTCENPRKVVLMFPAQARVFWFAWTNSSTWSASGLSQGSESVKLPSLQEEIKKPWKANLACFVWNSFLVFAPKTKQQQTESTDLCELLLQLPSKGRTRGLAPYRKLSRKHWFWRASEWFMAGVLEFFTTMK